MKTEDIILFIRAKIYYSVICNFHHVDRVEPIHSYLKLSLYYKEIIFCLAHRYSIVVSLRHLKQILERLRLYRRKHRTGILNVALFIEGEFGHTGQLHGYKWMHQTYLKEGIVVGQETVRHLLHILDPMGIYVRRARRLRRS